MWIFLVVIGLILMIKGTYETPIGDTLIIVIGASCWLVSGALMAQKLLQT